MARTQVQSELLAVNSISGTIIADNAITATHIATNAISGTLVQDGGIVTVMIAANNVTATKIVTDAIQTRHIADDQVTEAKLANAINTSIAAKLPLAGGTMTGNIAHASDFTLDVGGRISLDNGDGYVELKQNGTVYGFLDKSGDALSIQSVVDNGDIILRGKDSGTVTTALTLDMSDAGKATFNAGATFDGNVGIGDTDPGAKLDVNSGTTNTIAHFHSTDDNGFIELKDDNTTGYIGVQDDYVYIGGAPSRSTQNLVINDGDGKVGIGNTSPSTLLHLGGTAPGDSIIRQDSTSSGTNWEIGERAAGKWQIFEDDNDSIVATFMSTGRVGIGVTDPDGELHVESAGNADVYVERTSGAKIHLQAQSAFTAIGAASNHDLGLMTNASTRMRIDNTGRVGINRTPSKANSKLEVGGADNVGLIHVEASGNFASWGIGSNQSKFYYNDTQMMGLTNEGVMKLMGGVDSGRQDLLFNNGAMSLANEATYTLSSVLNTGALLSIGANRSNLGVTYDHCLLFAETGTVFTTLADPSGRFAINSATTANKVNIFVNGSSVVIQNKVGSTVGICVAAFVFQGN